ncbi:hypothetical protein ACFHW2_02850 [Actinomadura sp. LOL_016]
MGEGVRLDRRLLQMLGADGRGVLGADVAPWADAAPGAGGRQGGGEV